MIQERIKTDFQAIQLPNGFIEEDRGLFRCCTPELVLADAGSDSWKTDKTSAWCKLSDMSDTVDFILRKNGVVTSYTPTAVSFINEPNAYYSTVNWIDVLTSDGIGCYTIELEYSIAGITASLTWGEYELKPYSITNALTTCRLRAIFNCFNEIEGINFTGSEVESTLRFNGIIGQRQPNTEINNLIYNSREVKKVIRENLNTYQIKSDPLPEDFTRQIIDVYLLDENDLFISDYNAHSHSYRILDLPVTLEESASLEYKELSRNANVNAVVGDKFKNQRSYY